MVSSAAVLDREDAVLAVIDIQERLAIAMPHREKVIARTRLLIHAAGIVGVPVIATRQYPKGLGDMEPDVLAALADIEQQGARVMRLDKLSFDCFSEEEFRSAVSECGRRQLVIAGMESHICVAQTALAGIRDGLEVHVAADACCSRSDEHHHLALARVGHAGGVVSTSESAAYELVGRAGTDEFKALLAVVKS